MLDRLTVDDFAPLVGQDFSLGEHLLPLRLISVTPSRRPAPPPARAGFALLFQGPATAPLDQGQHRLSHAQLGDLDLFIVPVAERGDTRDYEAIFN